MTSRLSPSVARELPLRRKASEGLDLLREYRSRAAAGHDHGTVFAEIAEYDELLERYAGVRLAEAKVFEVGFGARPYRQIAMHSMGIDVGGVDAEVPVLSGHPAEYRDAWKRNGAERVAKSLVRHVLFDRGERSALEAELRRRGYTPRLDRDRLIVADARAVEISPGSLDLVFSEDVFEHMQVPTVEEVTRRIATWLRPGGLALIRPNIFPGIIGGHLIEWSRDAMKRPSMERKSEPWEHLRQRRFKPNTYLNELRRSDFRRIFSEHFEILEERPTDPDMGRAFYSDDVRAELAAWPEDELFSNQVLFALRPRAGS